MAGTNVKEKPQDSSKDMQNNDVKTINEELKEEKRVIDEKELSEEEKKIREALLKTYRYLLFESDGEQYGINIEYVNEIIGIQEITHLPGMPNYVKGLINLRGKIIPVIDAREKFGKQKVLYNDRTCVIVLEVDNIIVGLVVDVISDVITVREDILEEAPRIGKIKTNKYISNIAKIDNKVKLLIDCEKLINE